MVQELLNLLPDEVSTGALYALVGLAAAGLGVWLLGARWSRPVVTLVLVAAGTLLGRALPGWMGWSIDPMGPAIGGALVLGLSGYILHRMWVGIALGGLLALWAAVGCWVMFSGEHAIDWSSEPELVVESTPREIVQAQWEALPPELTSVLPWACGTALVLGATLAFMWPRVAVALLYSGLGVTLVAGCGLAAMHAAKPDWIAMLPQQLWAQLAILAGMLLVGTLVQIRMLRPRKKSKDAEAEADDDLEDPLIGYKARRA